jgi:hypothetical protein
VESGVPVQSSPLLGTNFVARFMAFALRKHERAKGANTKAISILSPTQRQQLMSATQTVMRCNASNESGESGNEAASAL